MLYDIEALLINFSVIIIPIFLYQFFWVDKGLLNSRWNKWIILILSAVEIILCMNFPISLIPGYRFDMRQIPLILGILYGGYDIGLFLYLISITYRFFLGGEGSMVNLIVASLTFLINALYRNNYLRYNRKQKLIYALCISTLLSISIKLLPGLISDGYPNFNFASTTIYIIVQAFSMWIIIYIIETMLVNVKIREEILFTEKLKIISELSASISHEIRNPLTVSMGFLQLFKKGDLPQEKQNYYVNLSLAELERAEKIISDYLSLSKSQAENMVVSNLQEELNYITSLITPYAHMHGVQIITTFTNSIEISYDRNQLRQSLINMTKNSIEAMSDGGSLTLSISSRGSAVVIIVKDTGTGMTKEQIERLGSPYYTTKEKGTGLGMTIVYNTFHSMNATIQVDSQLNTGTIFTVNIPKNIQLK